MEDWTWQLEGEGIDFEAQRREFERLEQARQDRIVAEELQGDLARLPVERDFPVKATTKAPTPLSSLQIAPSPPEDLSGPSTSRQNGNTAAVISPSPPRQCWVEDKPGDSSASASPLLRSRSPISTLPILTSSTNITPVSPSPLYHSARNSPHNSLPNGLGQSLSNDCSLGASVGVAVSNHPLELDLKLAEQLQEQERKERETREKLSHLDHHLALELMQAESSEREEGEEGGEGKGENGGVLERIQRRMEMCAQSQRDAELARALQDEEQQGRGEEREGGKMDIDLAQRFQWEENQQVLTQTDHDEQLAHALQSTPSREEDTSHDEELAKQIAAQFEATPISPMSASMGAAQQLLAKPPSWWTRCPNCPPDSNRKYHLIEINSGENEWLSVTSQLSDAGFTPQRLRRVQNMKLYQRLQFEKENMKPENETSGDYHVNETLLYHTSSADVSTICGEGLDQRLSRKGRFGSGVYFSDDPVKCDSYWRGSGTKTMFACYVLLGNVKKYPRKQTDPTLLREPPGYDSVKGNMSGHNEYIVYSHYRAMPAYVIEYR